MAVGGGCMDLVDDVHTFDYPPKRGEALTVRISFAAEVQFGLIADADEKVVCRRVGTHTCHRDRAVKMT